MTIDAAAQGTGNGPAGLFAGSPDGDYRFYGTFSQSGGQNPARPAAAIIIVKGSALSRSLVTGEPGEEFIQAVDSTIIILNRGGGNTPEPAEYVDGGGISGYCNWGIPGG